MSNQLSHTEKKEIQYKLRNYVGSFSSQKKASQSIEGCSEAYVIAMLSKDENNWKQISDAMWRNVGAQVGGGLEFDKMVETLVFQTLQLYYDTAKENGASFGLVGNAGWGKSYTAKWYAAAFRKDHVYYLECTEHWTQKIFLQKLLNHMGANYYGMGIGEMMESLVREIRKQHKPLIIMDEVDKLSDKVLKFFITLYNQLNKHCGFIWQSTDAIKKRMVKGVERNVVGYQELFSRIGATFVQLPRPSADEIAEICSANGITGKEQVAGICNEVLQIGGDLRRVERITLKHRINKNRKAA